jgi:flagellar assembly protein FliH
MSNAMPKGQMSAFQRWEMASFGDDRPAEKTDDLILARAKEKANQAEMDHAREAARREGNVLGFQEGFATGLVEGQNAGKEKMESELAQIQTMATAFSAQLSDINQAIGQDILKFAIDLAQAMIKTKLECNPEVILPLLRDALDCLPSVQQPAQINLHPDDALIVKNHMNEEIMDAGWRIISDSNIERGGCSLETAHNLVDATFATRWQRLIESFKSGLPGSGST